MRDNERPYSFADLMRLMRKSGETPRYERIRRQKTKNQRRANNRLARKNRRLNLRTGHTAGKQ